AEQTFWVWPLPDDLVQAARHFHGRLHPGGDAWVGQAQAMADRYVREFMQTSAIAARAREGGYEAELKRYVVAASWVQSQYVLGRQGVGYDSNVLFPGPRDKEAEQEWFARAREQAETGRIKVTIPAALIRRWQEEAVRGRAR